MEDGFSQTAQNGKRATKPSRQQPGAATTGKSASFRELFAQDFADILYTKDIFLDIGRFLDYFTVA
jgi:hypothetical protein